MTPTAAAAVWKIRFANLVEEAGRIGRPGRLLAWTFEGLAGQPGLFCVRDYVCGKCSLRKKARSREEEEF